MGEHTLTIKLAELTTVRICCRNGQCGTVLEVPIDQIGHAMARMQMCPSCGMPLYATTSGTRSPFNELSNLLRELNALKSVGIEFTLPIPKE